MPRMMRLAAALLVLLSLGQALSLELSTVSEAKDLLRVAVDPTIGHDISSKLFGIFFEEINHAGEGGLYAELINDRSFDGLAYESGFLDSSATHLTLQNPLPAREAGVNPTSWRAPAETRMQLTKAAPLNAHNRIALNVTSENGEAVIFNEGYWGIGVAEGEKYHLKLYLQGNSSNVTVSLESRDGEKTYASTSFTNTTHSWKNFSAVLESNGTDSQARLALRFRGRSSLLVDFVSLFPGKNGPVGSRTPFRQDLLALLKALKPRTVRLPGGCYVEGVKLADGFFWEPSVGDPEERPGHWNGPWRYWSTDGLGLFEYMQLAEELEADAVWVLNNGIAHEESVTTSRIYELVQDALNSLEFIKGSSDSKWGSLRAKLGRERPWNLTYLAIGNEDCGKPFYTTNYLIFYGAIHAEYPELRLISNCYMGDSAPAQLWDWHWYTDSYSMFAGRIAFDGTSHTANGTIYASEYAVFDQGIATSPGGNLQGAIAEAGFMTGLQRNSHAVEMAAFAPLFVHANHTQTCPSNLIMFNGARAFGSPSYHVQRLFSEFQGVKYLATAVIGGSFSVAASSVCLESSCRNISIKVVNFKDRAQNISLEFLGGSSWESRGEITTLTGDHPLDSNSVEEPHKIAPNTSSAAFSVRPELTVPGWSLTVINLELTKPSVDLV